MKKKELEIIKYEISKDKQLLAYFNNKEFYHIHSNELNKLEKWIKRLLIKQEKK